MVKVSALIFSLILGAVTSLALFHSAHGVLLSSSEQVVTLENASFAFGWSSNIGEQWIVNGEILILNSKALVPPPTGPIETDAGAIQENPYDIYLNKIGFGHGWCPNADERYRPSFSMSTGGILAYNQKALVGPPDEPIQLDAGPQQLDASIIHLNKIGFQNAWSQNPEERFRPSSSTMTGSLTGFNSRALSTPPTAPLQSDSGSDQEDSTLIHLNKAGFHHGWSANPEDRYRSSPTMEVGPVFSFNLNGPKEPPNEAIEAVLPTLDISVTLSSILAKTEETILVSVQVTDDTVAVKDALVELNSDQGGMFTPQSGYTSHDGFFTANFTTPAVSEQTDLRITAIASRNGYLDGADSRYLAVLPPDAVSLSITIIANPTTVQPEQTSIITVQVTDDTSQVSDASVVLTSDDGDTLSPTSGYTNSSGHFTSTFTAPTVAGQTTITITAVASKTGYLDGQGQTQVSITTTTLSVSVTANPPSVQSGETSTITAHVTHNGNAVSEATVTMLSNGGGAFTQSSGTTSSNGYFTTAFTAPTANTQTAVTITAEATKTGYLNGQDQAEITVNPSQPLPPEEGTPFWIYLMAIVVILSVLGFGIILARRQSRAQQETVSN